jgi:hypothetical protein
MTPQPKPILDWINNEINAISPIVAARMRRGYSPHWYNSNVESIESAIFRLSDWTSTKEDYDYWKVVRETISLPNFRDPIELLPAGYEDVVVEELPYIILKKVNPKYDLSKLCICGAEYLKHFNIDHNASQFGDCQEFTPAPVPTEPTKEERIERRTDELINECEKQTNKLKSVSPAYSNVECSIFFIFRKLAEMQIDNQK